VLLTVLYKTCVGIIVGFIVDAVIRALHKNDEKINIDAICDEDNCHCERGIFYSAIHHTLTITLFVFIVTLAINALVFFIGEERLGALMYDKPFISHLIASVFGLIPNCAASVVLATLCSEGIITAGTMLAGLFSGAGVGLLVLFKVNKRVRDNLIITAVLVVVGIIFGLLGDLIFPASMFAV
ncbi:MAG: arsenic efflux protein, partial [Clostridia bacterium]|nr:arsenic efflux protein [Clostridia bacterium]